jgi:MoaA/NifB/PqqE/SkfB family radical SAM enzyme
MKLYKVGIEITYRCNLKCPFCYINSELRQTPDISLDKLFPIIDEISKSPCLLITLLGGEPFLREDLVDIYKYLTKKGLYVHIYTNGTILHNRILDFFNNYPPYLITIPLYAGSDESYKKITGEKEVLKTIFEFVSLVKRKNIRFRFTTLITKLNLGELNKILKIVEKFEAPLTFSTKVGPAANGNNFPCKFRLSPQERTTVLKTIKNRKNIIWRDLDLARDNSCPGILLIDNFGNLTTCIIDRSKRYDLKKIPFPEALREVQNLKMRCPCK